MAGLALRCVGLALKHCLLEITVAIRLETPNALLGDFIDPY